jgi:putative MFS transporter
LGAALFGRLSERYGRMRMLQWTVGILSVFGFACAFAWGYWSLVALRFVQGLGIGGEIPVAVTFVSEISSAGRRGRFVLLYQLIYPVGFMAASLGSIVIVPHLGWQWMFIIGALPAFLTIVLRRLVPESPRWLARHGRLREADGIMVHIEGVVARESRKPLRPPQTDIPREAPRPARWTEPFKGIYLRRTLSVWAMWFCSAAIGYGLLVWLPTIFRTVYDMTIQQSLIYSSLGNITVLLAGLGSALLIDKVGRRPIFIVSFSIAGLALIILWLLGKDVTAVTVMIMAAIASTSMSMVQLGLWTYTPEIYPTRTRSFSTGLASAWARAASMIAPAAVGFLLARSDISAIFLMFGIVGFIGALTVCLFCVETSQRLLEEISP